MAQTQDWKNDQRLEHDLKLYVSQNLKRVEILDYMKRDYGDYNRSLRTISSRCLWLPGYFFRKLLFLFLCFENSEPEVIGKNYLKYLSKSKLLPYFLRVNRGTETGKMCSIHAFFQTVFPLWKIL